MVRMARLLVVMVAVVLWAGDSFALPLPIDWSIRSFGSDAYYYSNRISPAVSNKDLAVYGNTATWRETYPGPPMTCFNETCDQHFFFDGQTTHAVDNNFPVLRDLQSISSGDNWVELRKTEHFYEGHSLGFYDDLILHRGTQEKDLNSGNLFLTSDNQNPSITGDKVVWEAVDKQSSWRMVLFYNGEDVFTIASGRSYANIGIAPFGPQISSDGDTIVWYNTYGDPAIGYMSRVVPEPATLILLGTGLVGAFLRKRRA